MIVRPPRFRFQLPLPGDAIYADWEKDPVTGQFIEEQPYRSKLRALPGSRQGIATVFKPIEHRNKTWGVKFPKDPEYTDIHEQYERQCLGYEHGVAPKALCMCVIEFEFPDGKVIEREGFITEVVDRHPEMEDPYYSDGHYTYWNTRKCRTTYISAENTDVSGRYTRRSYTYEAREWVDGSDGWRGSPEYSELHDTLFDLFGRQGVRDLHGNNIGRRRDGALVCLDYGME
jgi:hypothetical protein